MKYIRTKDGVYEIERYYEQRDYYWVKQDCEEPIGSYEIINKADTIEELCDAFVVNFNDNENHIEVYESMEKDQDGWLFKNEHKMPIRHIANVWSNRPFEIYGAIWVKGEQNEPILKPAAKMNEEGELELL